MSNCYFEYAQRWPELRSLFSEAQGDRSAMDRLLDALEQRDRDLELFLNTCGTASGNETEIYYQLVEDTDPVTNASGGAVIATVAFTLDAQRRVAFDAMGMFLSANSTDLDIDPVAKLIIDDETTGTPTTYSTRSSAEPQTGTTNRIPLSLHYADVLPAGNHEVDLFVQNLGTDDVYPERIVLRVIVGQEQALGG